MKKLIVSIEISLVTLVSFTFTSYAADCGLVYDEFDSLMNKSFLTKPAKYVETASKRLSRNEYDSGQKGKFLLKPERKGLGVAIVHTNSNTWGKLLYTWGAPFQKGSPTLIIKEVVLYGRVTDGFRPRTQRNINIRSSFTVDLDTGKTGGKAADVWFNNIDGKTMYIEAVNGASLTFPMQSLCKSKIAHLAKIKPQAKLNTNQKFKGMKMNQKAMKSVDMVVLGTAGTAGNNANTNSGSSGSGNPFGGDLNKTVVKRELLPNGHVMITYSDGSRTERYFGGMTQYAPDGSVMPTFFYTSAPVAIPVGAPDQMEAQWLDGHRNSLKGIIETLVEDPGLVDQVLSNVDTSGNTYESIRTRSNLIQQLVMP